MAQQHRTPSPGWQLIGRALHAMAAAAVLAAVTSGLPWLLVTLAGSPIPDRLPGWDDIVAALSRRDDGTLLLGFLTYLTWALWAIWTALVLLEAAAHLRGHSAPQIPGLTALQQVAALLIGSLGMTALGTSLSVSRASALPPMPFTSAVTGTPRHAGTASEGVRSGPTPATRGTPTASADSSQPRPDEGAAAITDPAEDAWRRMRAVQQSAAASVSPKRDTVRFAFDSADLSPAAETKLAQAAHDVRAHADPADPIVLVGHTDSIGPPTYNQRLSVRRAEAVRRALAKALGDGYRYEVIGKGQTAPIAAETRPDGSDYPAGRARNRCVEITYTRQQPPNPTPPSTPHPTTSQPATPPHQPSPHPTTQSPNPSTSTPPPAPSAPHGGAGATKSGKAQPPAPSASPGRGEPGTAVRLPTGALLGLGLAAAVSTAVAATRIHRRRRRTPNADDLTVAEPEPPHPPAIAALRKAHLDTYTAAGLPIPSDQQLVTEDFEAAAPTKLTVGIRDGQPLSIPLSGLNAGLTGPGALATARALATELLAGAHRYRIELLIPQPDATTLFDLAGDELTDLADTVPGLILTPDLSAALRHLETEILHRARMMNDHDAPDLPALRVADPDEPLPAIVLIAATDHTERFTRTLHAALNIADPYGIGALLLGPWPLGATCHIDANGHVTESEGPHAHAWTGAQLFHLTSVEAADLLRVIRTARGAPEPSPAPSAKASGPTDVAENHSAPALTPPPKAKDDQPRPVRLRIFGPVRVETPSGQISTGLRRIARDLLALLALHPEGITRDQAIDAIWQDRDLDSGTTMFHTAVNNTRQALRRATGLREPMFINHVDGRYHLDANLIDVDLWHFLHALDTAAHAETDADRTPALRDIADLYTAELADDLTYEWAETERERIRRTATDALVRLARILHDDQPDQALTILERAFDHDPYSEPLAQELMRLQAHLGHLDAVRRTQRLLAYRLNDLDIDPTPETDQLAANLTRRSTPSRRNVASAD